MIALPLVDVHRVVVDVPLARLWASMHRTLVASFGGLTPTWYAAAVGCEPARASGTFPAPGSTLPGFRVITHRREDLLELEGRHLFSTYRLRVEGSGECHGPAELRAHTLAEFPGVPGAAYRAVVVSTRVHALAMSRLMQTIRRDALSGAGR